MTHWEVVTVKILPAFLGNGRKQIIFVKIHNASSFFVAKYFHALVVICRKDSGKLTLLSISASI